MQYNRIYLTKFARFERFRLLAFYSSIECAVGGSIKVKAPTTNHPSPISSVLCFLPLSSTSVCM